MIVVSDTSPVTALLQTGHGELLPGLFADVVIPPAVHVELLRFHASLPDWLRVQLVANTQQVAELRGSLDPGEAEAIVLAQECNADYLLIDEKLGREAALARGVKAIGLMGVLLLAKREGHLKLVRPLIEELERAAGFFVSEGVKAIILRAANEMF